MHLNALMLTGEGQHASQCTHVDGTTCISMHACRQLKDNMRLNALMLTIQGQHASQCTHVEVKGPQ